MIRADAVFPAYAKMTIPKAGIRQRLIAYGYDRLMARYEAHIADRKRALFADLPLSILEIGPGTGANLPYMPTGCRWLVVEPNPHMHKKLEDHAANFGVEAEFRSSTAERIDVESDSLPAVVSTLTLCSVSNLVQTLSEIRRVLRPGGKFYFVEHIAAPRSTWLCRWQYAVKPLWTWFSHGCRPNRRTDIAITDAGFRTVEMDSFRIPLRIAPPFVSPHVAGVAVK